VGWHSVGQWHSLRGAVKVEAVFEWFERGHVANKRRCLMRVQYRFFKSSFKSWDALCEEASAFATTIGRGHLINISVTLGETGGQGVIFVWYWE